MSGFNLNTTTWRTNTLTWSFANQNFFEGTLSTPFTSFNNDAQYQATVRLAVSMWAGATNLNLIESPDSKAVDIRVGWGHLPPLVNAPTVFVQYGVTLIGGIESFAPDVLVQLEDPHIEPITGTTAADQTYTNLGSTLLQVALQGVGVALGLDYNGDPNSVLYAYLDTGGSRTFLGPQNLTLDATDIDGIRALFPPCFFTGTAILTSRGSIPVELLQRGDRIYSVLGRKFVPVKWIGHRHLDCRRHPRPNDILPIRVRQNAFGHGYPVRDLWLSPDHAIFTDHVLIPIRFLVNGATIVQETCDALTYWHVELEHHGVLLAEGLPCESYLDTGNRAAFTNGCPAVTLHPDFALKVWETKACANLVVDGPHLEAAKSVVLAQAAALGHRQTRDPGFEVVAEGRPLRATRTGQAWHVRLPRGACRVRLQSRAWVPAHMLADSDDTRSLGVAIDNIRLDGRALALDDPRLSEGWHAPELQWRWTGGAAGLTLAGVRNLSFDVAMTGYYWDAPVAVHSYHANAGGAGLFRKSGEAP